MRDDFFASTKELLARRVGLRCSNPGCRKPTSGPQEDPRGAVNIGVAAHIAAASPSGPRYDAQMTPEQRSSIENGIWLCQNCAKLIDNDPLAYPTDIVKMWRMLAEMTAKNELERGITIPVDDRFVRIERDMPELVREMRNDLANHPLAREFVCMSKRWSVWTDALRYHYEDHPHLDDQVRILQNRRLVHEIPRGKNIRFFRITEPLADYLRIARPDAV